MSKCIDCVEWRRQVRQAERERDEYAKCVSAMLEAVSKLATGSLSGGIKALRAKELIEVRKR